MRALLLIPTVVTATAACGFAICRGAGFSSHTPEMISAAIVGLLAGELALAPLILSRGATHEPIVQASLFGTLIHLLVCVAGSAVVLLGKFGGQSFVFWMFAFYWMTLMVLVVAFAQAMKAAPAAQASKL